MRIPSRHPAASRTSSVKCIPGSLIAHSNSDTLSFVFQLSLLFTLTPPPPHSVRLHSVLNPALPAFRMAEHKTSSGKETAISKRPPSVNFPLPRELRDEIYGYLLLPVKGSRKHRFHTNHLAVNRTVHGETEEHLYHNNDFVAVSFEWRWWKDAALGQLPPLEWISHVSQNHVARMRYHNMRLHFIRNGGHELGGQSDGLVQSAILLAEDLPELCPSMQIRFAGISGPAVVIGASNRGNGARGLGISGLGKGGNLIKATEIVMELRTPGTGPWTRSSRRSC